MASLVNSGVCVTQRGLRIQGSVDECCNLKVLWTGICFGMVCGMSKQPYSDQGERAGLEGFKESATPKTLWKALLVTAGPALNLTNDSSQKLFSDLLGLS